jgi:hypothetical protein
MTYGEPEATVMSEAHQVVADYIFYQHEKLGVRAIMTLPSVEARTHRDPRKPETVPDPTHPMPEDWDDRKVLHSPYTVLYSSYTVLYSPYTVLYSPYTVLHSPYTVLYYHTLYCTHYPLYSPYTVLYSSYTVLHSPYTVLYSPYTVLYSSYTVLHSPYWDDRKTCMVPNYETGDMELGDNPGYMGEYPQPHIVNTDRFHSFLPSEKFSSDLVRTTRR